MKRADPQPSGAGERRPPWSPLGIAVLTLLFSPLPAGILHALNYRRLGWTGRVWLAVAADLLAALLLTYLILETELWGWVSSIFLATWFYKTQQPSFRKHRADGGGKASILPPMLLSLGILVAFFAGFVYIAADRNP
jgi:hypothetical protein